LLDFGKRFATHFSFDSRRNSGIPRLNRTRQSKFGILCYHRVGTEGVPLYSRLHPDVFEAQMRYLKAHYRVVPLAQLIRELKEGARVPLTLAVTFDDGYQDLHRYALPVLTKYSIPATVYLIGACIESGEAPWYDRIYSMLETFDEPIVEFELGEPRRFSLLSWQDRLEAAWEIVCFLRSIPDVCRRAWCEDIWSRYPVDEKRLANRMLNWKQVHEMRLAGVSFGAHTMTHPIVSRLDVSQFPAELMDSKQLLESRIGEPIDDFAFPFGKPEDISTTARAYLGQCGYRSAVSTVQGHNLSDSDLLGLRRIQVNDCSSIKEFSFGLLRTLLSGPAASADPEGSTAMSAPAGDRLELGGS
jgi:peptidoglycan/xylan/chitin deacetylase (PgdA/CDA1 family)